MVEKKMEIKQIKIDDNSPLLKMTKGMFSKEFPSDLRQLKFFAQMITQKAPPEIKERHLLGKQISELIKNAIIHGHKEDKSKKVKVSFAFTHEKAHVIVEDQGEGFKEIEEWNRFYEKRCNIYVTQNFEDIEKYRAFKTPRSRAEDEGMALFEALTFWNGGVVFSSSRNCVGVLKIYPQKKQYSIE